MRYKYLSAVVLTLNVLLTGCSTSTLPGAVGITRTQLLLVPSSTVNAQASLAYKVKTDSERNLGRLNANAETTKRVQQISQRLIAQVGTFRPDASRWAWEVNVVQSDEVQATCAPGGKIIVYSGIIDKLSLNDDQLAAVIGHEIAHALREHTRERASQQQLSSAVVQGIANSRMRNANLAGSAANLGSSLFVLLPYSRDMELEADVMGLELMARAGFDPEQAPGLWRKMLAMQNTAGRSDFFDTHPNSEIRAVAIEAMMPRILALQGARTDRTALAVADVKREEKAILIGAPDTVYSEQSRKTPAVNAPSFSRQATEETHLFLGRSSFQVERVAKRQMCSSEPIGLLTGKGPGTEEYLVKCADGTALKFQCEFTNCHLVS